MSPVCARVSLAGKEFDSQKAAKSYVSQLLQRKTLQSVRRGDDEFPLLLALLERHPNYDQKVTQPPVESFYVAVNAMRGLRTGRELQFVDQRGIKTAFSVQKCIT